MDNASAILSHISTPRLVNLLVDAVDCYSPSFAEMPAMEVFTAALDRMDVTYSFQRIDTQEGDERSNLLVRIGPDPLSLLLVGHVDTVTLWHDEGHEARIDGDRVFGLGTADMKGGCAAMIEALGAVLRSGENLCRGLCIAFVVGEEENGDGSRVLRNSLHAPLTVIGEPSNLRPCIAHYGYLEAMLLCNGLRAHAALPEVGANANQTMLAWVMNILDAAQQWPLADRPSINLREIHGGKPDFAIAESCEALLDVHLPPWIGRHDVEALIERSRAAVLTTHPDSELHCDPLLWAAGFRYDPGDARLAPIQAAYHATGLTWNPDTFRSHSDAGLFHEQDTMAIVCGPGNLEAAHRRGEYVLLQQLEQAARVYAALICAVCMQE